MENVGSSLSIIYLIRFFKGGLNSSIFSSEDVWQSYDEVTETQT